jgi:predicted kinase
VRHVARLIHLNGAPAIGKSTLARRYGEEHPGVLVCDVDVLRTMISGWQDDLEAAERSRTMALAMITAFLGSGRDVVLPQLVARDDQLARFRAAAEAAGAEHVHVMLVADADTVVGRFRARADLPLGAWNEHATAFWEAEGGEDALRDWTRRLDRMDATRVRSTTPEATYDAVLAALGDDA